MTAKYKPTSPLLGWMAAGVDMLSAQVEQVTGMVTKQLDATHELFEELQQRGEVVDKEMRESLNSSSFFSSLQTMMMANPLVSLFPGAKKAQMKEQQLDMLSTKVDLLVEQVALLAAKKAASKKAQAAKSTANAKEEAKPTSTRKRTTTAKSSTTKASTTKATTTRKSSTAASKAKAPATKPAAKSTTAKKRTTKTTAKKADS